MTAFCTARTPIRFPVRATNIAFRSTAAPLAACARMRSSRFDSYFRSARIAWSPTGTIRSFRPFPRTLACCVTMSRSPRLKPCNSESRIPVE